jgi:hypothetical protein
MPCRLLLQAQTVIALIVRGAGRSMVVHLTDRSMAADNTMTNISQVKQ